jgi:hypothetical protein
LSLKVGSLQYVTSQIVILSLFHINPAVFCMSLISAGHPGQ